MSLSNEKRAQFVQDLLSKRSKYVSFCYSLSTQRFLFISDNLFDKWGVHKEDAMKNADTLKRSIHAQDIPFLQDSLTQLRRNKQVDNVQFRFLMPDKTVNWISISATLNLFEGEELAVGTAEDVTIFREYIDTMQKFSSKKNTVLSIVSHDLVGPLNNIKIVIGMLRGQTNMKNNEEVNRLLHLADTSSQRSIDIIRDLINQEFLESSEVRLNKQRTDVVQALGDIIGQYRKQESELLKTFFLRSNYKSVFLPIDQSKFFQAINNLLSNAVKFTHDNGVISLDIEDSPAHVLFTIRDNGIGIPEEMQPFLFDKFTQARRKGLKGEATVGLGMSLIKSIVEWHDGTITFESKEEEGTTFFIQIPK